MPKPGQILSIRIPVTCPCGTKMFLTKREAERKRYCSKACLYRYRVRPDGLTYTITAENSGWFKAGHKPHNLGTAQPKALKGRPRGVRHFAWKGDDAGYDSLHNWVRRYKPEPEACEECGTDAPLDASNISGEYRRDVNDWRYLCRKCHFRYDRENIPGASVRKRS